VRLDRSTLPLAYVGNYTATRCSGRTFQVTHPFHPWHRRQFELIAYKTAWGEDRVYFYNEEQQLIALPASWTDVVPANPFLAIARGCVANSRSETVSRVPVLFKDQ
jgi:hypothetical protein